MKICDKNTETLNEYINYNKYITMSFMRLSFCHKADPNSALWL